MKQNLKDIDMLCLLYSLPLSGTSIVCLFVFVFVFAFLFFVLFCFVFLPMSHYFVALDNFSGVPRAFQEERPRGPKWELKWGKSEENKKTDENLRKNEESGTLAHPGRWGWLRPWIISTDRMWTNALRNHEDIDFDHCVWVKELIDL